jgi:hypothetical protein
VGHPIHKVTAFEILGLHRIRVTFADGLVRVIDFGPILHGELHGPLSDPKQFNAVTLDPEVHTLVWPNGADFDPATLHDWPEHEPAMMDMARRWAGAGEKAS